MQVTDAIADMLTRIRNANDAKLQFVEIPASNIKKQIAQILQDEGYIKAFRFTSDSKQGMIRITLKYTENQEKVIQGIKRVSKPGLRVYSKSAEMPRVMKGLGTAIVSTSQGVMTDKKARVHKIGGEILAYVW